MAFGSAGYFRDGKGWADSRFAMGQAGQSSNFLPTRQSLQGYRVPDWFRDAKFGIWSHWGPQSAIEQGDWYARNMYMEGSEQYLYHCENYGDPSKVGYKDLVNIWKAEKWDPDHLMGLYKKAGAKYFFRSEERRVGPEW